MSAPSILASTSKIQELISSVAFAQDCAKAQNGNAAAGTRVRKVMQEIKALATQVRSDVTTIKGDRKYAEAHGAAK